MNEDMDGMTGKRDGRVNVETSPELHPEEWEKWLKPFCLGLLDIPGMYSASAGSEGERISIFLRFEGDKVKQANFYTTGCMACSLCCFYASRMALGKSSDELDRITGETIVDFMGGLPEKDHRCAFLVSEALQKVLRDYRMKQQPDGPIARKARLALVRPAEE